MLKNGIISDSIIYKLLLENWIVTKMHMFVKFKKSIKTKISCFIYKIKLYKKKVVFKN